MKSRSERNHQVSASDGFLGFTSSVAFDSRLWRYDIAGSIAHANMLAEADVITGSDHGKMVEGLRAIASDLGAGRLRLPASAEDVHMAIEKELIDRAGDAGARLHTGRSRNDQVALDMRLYTREALLQIIEMALSLQRTLVEMAERDGDAILPGYTHLQHGQPVLLSHHLMSYFWKLQRDIDRLADCYDRASVSPLGAGALAGTAFPLNRSIAMKTLRMRGITENSLDAVSDRDFVAEGAFAASLLAMHMSSLCEEVILWSSSEFRFIKLPKRLSGGSSMMPQKRNPDIPELVRAKSGRALGGLVTILALLKSLPLAYNRDLQEDKENLFDVFDTVGASLHALTPFLAELEFDRARMRESAEIGLMTATDLADFLTTRGMPFRTAHGLVKELAELSEGDEVRFRELALEKLATHTKKLDIADLGFLTLENAVERRSVEGGTSTKSVKKQMEKAVLSVEGTESRVRSMRQEVASVDELLS
jgi:argininosuccinate lyase